MTPKTPPAPTSATEYRVAFEGLESVRPETWAADFFGPYSDRTDAERRAAALRATEASYRNVKIESRSCTGWVEA